MQKCGERSGLQICGESLNFEAANVFTFGRLSILDPTPVKNNDGLDR